MQEILCLVASRQHRLHRHDLVSVVERPGQERNEIEKLIEKRLRVEFPRNCLPQGLG